MANFDETMQKELIALREKYDEKCKECEELYEENNSLEDEISELNSKIESTFYIGNEYVETITKFATKTFKEQMRVFYNLYDSKNRFSNKTIYDDLFEKQSENVYETACVLACFDELETALGQIPFSEKNLFIDEIQNKRELPDPYDM